MFGPTVLENLNASKNYVTIDFRGIPIAIGKVVYPVLYNLAIYVTINKHITGDHLVLYRY